MSKDSDRLLSILGTVFFHLLIILVLAITVLRANTPEEISFIEIVELGGGAPAYQGGGPTTPQPQPEVIPKPVTPPVQTQPEPRNTQPSVMTQEKEESLKIAEAKRKQDAEEKRRLEAEEKRRKAEEAERIRKVEEERKAASAINSQMAGAFGNGNGGNTGQGGSSTGTGQGDNPFGTGAGGTGTGTGKGYGSFNLDGRSLIGELPRPVYSAQEEGRIVVDITVDPQGKVIFAEIGPGTNITTESLRRGATESARKAKFSSINGTNNQRGTITYNYTLTGGK